MAIHAVFIDLAACDVVNFYAPLACAEIEVKGAARGIGMNHRATYSLVHAVRIPHANKRFRS